MRTIKILMTLQRLPLAPDLCMNIELPAKYLNTKQEPYALQTVHRVEDHPGSHIVVYLYPPNFPPKPSQTDSQSSLVPLVPCPPT